MPESVITLMVADGDFYNFHCSFSILLAFYYKKAVPSTTLADKSVASWVPVLLSGLYFFAVIKFDAQLSRVWPVGGLSASLLFVFCDLSPSFLSTSYFLTHKCSRRMLYFSCSSPGIGHFSQEPWFN